MIYLDSSALLKLLHAEHETEALEEWISARGRRPMVSSELAKVEVIRGCRRIDPETLPEARALLGGLDLIPLTGDVLDAAAEAGGTVLRSLDAIHLVSALSIRGDLDALVAYDHRLAGAASDAGLEVVHPGR